MRDDFERAVERLSRYGYAKDAPPGFGGLTIDRRSHAVTLYWHGEPPEEVQADVEAARAAASVSLQTAAHSARQLQVAARRIMGRLGQGRGVVGVSLRSDASGLTVFVDRPVRQALVQSIAGEVPVSLEQGSQPQPIAPVLHGTFDYHGNFHAG